ncbi:hypothetical protein NE237_031005 [Protea cynaroides]|uniref:Uncharacterized protein n=1 Tax=Protea cynaroides TaxID=273540 RepID=A0A9Q0GX00_9MAGN|nr:hypothetical protein NE237_031005 [Protea cynaroides]
MFNWIFSEITFKPAFIYYLFSEYFLSKSFAAVSVEINQKRRDSSAKYRSWKSSFVFFLLVFFISGSLYLSLEIRVFYFIFILNRKRADASSVWNEEVLLGYSSLVCTCCIVSDLFVGCGRCRKR